MLLLPILKYDHITDSEEDVILSIQNLSPVLVQSIDKIDDSKTQISFTNGKVVITVIPFERLHYLFARAGNLLNDFLEPSMYYDNEFKEYINKEWNIKK